MAVQVACQCGRGNYDPDKYNACFMCSSEGKEDCPACGKRRSVDPVRFMVCYACNQTGATAKCYACTQPDPLAFWQDLDDGRKLVICDDCLSVVGGDPNLVSLPQATLMPMPPRQPPAPTRPPPNINIGGQSFGSPGLGKHVPITPGQVAGSDEDRPSWDDDKAPWDDVEELVNGDMERAPTPLYAEGSRVHKGNLARKSGKANNTVQLKCPVCGIGSTHFADTDAPLCYACNISLNAEAHCMCCGNLKDRIFPQMRVHADREGAFVESYVTVCGSCLWGYHGANCDPPAEGLHMLIHPDIFPPVACALDGNLIRDGKPVCADCAKRRFDSIKEHNINWNKPENRGKGEKYLA